MSEFDSENSFMETVNGGGGGGEFAYIDDMMDFGNATVGGDNDGIADLDDLFNTLVSPEMMMNDSLDMADMGGDLNGTILGLDVFLRNLDDDFIMSGGRSQEGADMFEFLVEGVLLTAVSVFGLVGNVVAIVVLSRPPMRGSFSTLLIGKVP